MSIYKLEPGQRGTSNGPGDAKGLRIGHINARGLKNDEKIERLANMMRQHNFDVFGITETHYSDKDEPTTIRGYQRAGVECRNEREKKPVWGGVAVYVKEGVGIIPMGSQTYSYDKESENCIGPEDDQPVQYIHIKVTKIYEKIIPHIHVVIMYVPPKAAHKLTALVHFLQHNMGGYSSAVVLGDMNVNVFKSTGNVNKSGFGQIITEVTRSTDRSNTLLDHIYVKAFQFSESLSLNVRQMVKHSGVVQTHNIGDHDLIFCVVKESYLKRNYENTRSAYNTLLKSIGVEKQQARDVLREFSIRLLKHLVKAKTDTSQQTKIFSELSKETAESLCHDLSIDAYTAMEYHNNMRAKWPTTQLERIHITCGGKDVICLENKSSNDLGRFLYLCFISGAHKPCSLHKLKLTTMNLYIIDKSLLMDRQLSLQLKKTVYEIALRSTSRGVVAVRYTVTKSTNHQNYHTYVDSLVSELDVMLTPGEMGARIFEGGGKRGVILFSAGTEDELTSSLYKIIAVLQQLNPDVSFTSWRFYGQSAVKQNVCLANVWTMTKNQNLTYTEYKGVQV